jgi:hypothetical protein
MTPQQQPTLITATAETVITDATAVSVFASSGNTSITAKGSFVLSEGIGVSFEANGNVLGAITVTPDGGATALISVFK